jgi:hypothetical protein
MRARRLEQPYELNDILSAQDNTSAASAYTLLDGVQLMRRRTGPYHRMDNFVYELQLDCEYARTVSMHVADTSCVFVDCAADEEEDRPESSGRTGAGADSEGGGTDQPKTERRRSKNVRFEAMDDAAFDDLLQLQEVSGAAQGQCDGRG